MLQECPQGTRIKNIILIAIILVTSLTANAQELSQAYGRVENESTSDKFFRTSEFLSWRNHRREMNWNYEGEATESQDWGVNVDIHNGDAPGLTYAGQRLGVFAAKKYSPQLYSSAEIGIHRVGGTGTTLEKSLMALSSITEWLPTPEIYFNLNLRHDLIYTRALPAGANDGISEIAVDPNFTYRPIERIRVVGRNQYRWMSDGNRKRENDAAILYGLATAEYWVWVGMGVDYIEFTKRNPGYYSPERFYSWGPRLEAAGPLWGEFSGAVGYSHNTFQEGDLAWGTGHYSVVSLRHGNRNNLLLELQAIQNRSAQGATAWTSNQYSFSLLYSH